MNLAWWILSKLFNSSTICRGPTDRKHMSLRLSPNRSWRRPNSRKRQSLQDSKKKRGTCRTRLFSTLMILLISLVKSQRDTKLFLLKLPINHQRRRRGQGRTQNANLLKGKWLSANVRPNNRMTRTSSPRNVQKTAREFKAWMLLTRSERMRLLMCRTSWLRRTCDLW